MKFSSEPHSKGPNCGEFSRPRLKFSSENEVFKREWNFHAKAWKFQAFKREWNFSIFGSLGIGAWLWPAAQKIQGWKLLSPEFDPKFGFTRCKIPSAETCPEKIGKSSKHPKDPSVLKIVRRAIHYGERKTLRQKQNATGSAQKCLFF